MDINIAFNVLMGFEGGGQLVNNPLDKGKITRWGISQAAYPSLDIANLSEDKAKAIYGTDYWIAGNCPKLKPELQYVHFDTCVNCGVEEAVKLLQRAANITDDGIFGAQTLVQSDKVSIEAYLLQREWLDDTIVCKNHTQLDFLGGWQARNQKILSLFKEGKLG